MRTSTSGSMTPVAALALLLACGTETGDVPFAPSHAAGRSTTMARLESDEPPRFTDWSAPVSLGPVVNSPLFDSDVSLSRDGLSLYIGPADSATSTSG